MFILLLSLSIFWFSSGLMDYRAKMELQLWGMWTNFDTLSTCILYSIYCWSNKINIKQMISMKLHTLRTNSFFQACWILFFLNLKKFLNEIPGPLDIMQNARRPWDSASLITLPLLPNMPRINTTSKSKIL